MTLNPDIRIDDVEIAITYYVPFEGSTTIRFSWKPAPGDALLQALLDKNTTLIAQEANPIGAFPIA